MMREPCIFWLIYADDFTNGVFGGGFLMTQGVGYELKRKAPALGLMTPSQMA
jgi:hypothetical protein